MDIVLDLFSPNSCDLQGLPMRRLFLSPPSSLIATGLISDEISGAGPKLSFAVLRGLIAKHSKVSPFKVAFYGSDLVVSPPVQRVTLLSMQTEEALKAKPRGSIFKKASPIPCLWQ